MPVCLAVADNVGDSGCGHLGCFVLPDTYDGPAICCKTLVGVTIAFRIGFDFCGPPGRVVLWLGPMLRAAMPEAAVNENSNLSCPEDKVSAASQPWKLRIDPVPETPCVQQAPDGHLGTGVSAPLTDHPQKRLWTRCLRP